MRGLCIGAVLAVAAATAGRTQAPGDGITFSSGAWSNSPTRWTVHRDGSIDDARGAQQFAATLPVDMVVHHLPPVPGRYATIEHMLAPAKRMVGRKLDCTTQHTDDFYGRITWSDGVRLDYAFGCDGPANRPVIDAVRAASAQVSAWVADAPVIRHYQITTSEEFNRQ